MLDAPAKASEEPPAGPRAVRAGRWQFWRSPSDQPRWARPALLVVAALGGTLLQLGHRQRHARDLLRRRGAQHGGELARLLLRRLRPLGNGLGRQAAGGVLAPGALGAPLRLPHLGHRAAPGGRGDPDRPRPLPRRAPGGGRRRRPRRRPRVGGDARHHPVEPRQHLGLAAHPAAGARGGRHDGRLHHGTAAVPRPRRSLGRPGLPGQDAPGLDRPPRAVPGLHPRRARGQPGTAGRAGGPLRPRRRRRLAQLDVRGRPRPRARPPLRRRQLRQLRVQPGVPLQRRRPRQRQRARPAGL